MVVDIFTYNGEEDVLELRLNILSDYVDQFIIVEGTETFSGKDKPLYYIEEQDRFKKWWPKINYNIASIYPKDKEILALAYSSPNVPHGGPEHWRREFYQKESIKKSLTHLRDEDICFISDVDEIWNPIYLQDRETFPLTKLHQFMYVYCLNNLSTEDWHGTLVGEYRDIKDECLNHLRTFTPRLGGSYFGWHFSSMGGLGEVRRKLNDSYTSDSYNSPEVQHLLEERYSLNRDYMGRNFVFHTDERVWPQYLKDHKQEYIHLCK